MSQETLRIFDDQMQCIGQKSRAEVHQSGDWHETFHCWLIFLHNGKPFVLFQQRASIKKDYPNLFDVTCAGHLLSTERAEDGVREIEEELGFSVCFDELVSLGIITEELATEHMWDREFCHVYAYVCHSIPNFMLQKDEVDSIHMTELADAVQFFHEPAPASALAMMQLYPDSRNPTQMLPIDSFVGTADYLYLNGSVST